MSDKTTIASGFLSGQQMIDIIGPEKGIEVIFKDDGTTMWVNVDGVCRLRIGQIPERDKDFAISLLYPTSWQRTDTREELDLPEFPINKGA